MSDEISQAAALREAFDQIEESYEFMLAYAAQGRKVETQEGGGESQIRQYLRRFESALADMDKAIGPGFGDAGKAFKAQVQRDIEVARSVVQLLLARESISSDMIDNTNGLIALRALLTDIFYLDQTVLPTR